MIPIRPILLVLIVLHGGFAGAGEPEKRRSRPNREKKPEAVETRPEELITTIGNANLKSLPPKAEFKKGGRRDKNQISDPYRGLTQLEETITRKEPAVIRQRSFSILTEAEKQTKNIDWTRHSVMDAMTMDDLNILSGSKEHPHVNLGSILGERVISDLGKAYLIGLISRPTADVAVLRQRQEALRQLAALPEGETGLLRNFLKQFEANENYLIGLWGENLPQLFPQKDYFTTIGSSYLNESSTALLAKSYLNNLKAASSEGMKALAAGLLMAYGVSTFLGVETHYQEELSSYADRNLGPLLSRGSDLPMPRELVPALTYIEQPQIRGAIFTAAGYNAAKMLKTSLQQRHAELLQHDLLLKRVMHISQLILAMEEIRDILKAHPELTEHLTYFPALDAFFSTLPEEQKQIGKLFELLKTDTFSQEPDEVKRYVFNYGRVLVATRLLVEIEEHIALPLTAIGEADAYLALAELARGGPEQRVAYCFPEYLQNTAPELQLEAAWNPFVDPAKVVPNSLDLGRDGAENMVLTGPNSGGKSTILKSVALSVILAQSAGVVPAKGMKFTPFANITTYMNVKDSSVEQESLFQAEVKRVFQYGDTVRDLAQRHGFSFAIFDEIFSGTNPTRGVDLGLRVAKGLMQYPNNMSIISTHFRDLAARLEDETLGRYKNYKVVVNIHPDDRVERLYRLEPGISDQDIAELVFKEKGKDSPFFKDTLKQREERLHREQP